MIRHQPKTKTVFVTLTDGACAILLTSDAAKKADLSWDLAADRYLKSSLGSEKKAHLNAHYDPDYRLLCRLGTCRVAALIVFKERLTFIHAIAHIE